MRLFLVFAAFLNYFLTVSMYGLWGLVEAVGWFVVMLAWSWLWAQDFRKFAWFEVVAAVLPLVCATLDIHRKW